MIKKFYNTLLMLFFGFAAFAQPLTPAPTPTLSASNVISLFSNAYTNVGIDTWRTPWTPAATTLSDIQILGNDTKLYNNLEYVGVEFTAANTINATSMQYYHVDVWTPNATTFRVKLVDWGANGTYGGGDDVEHEYVVPTLTQNDWNSYDIPLSAFTGLTTRAHLEQMIFSAAPAGSANTYIDNVYFYNVANAPTLSNFSVPTQVAGAAPFTITAPTSNSTGAFTYLSTNTSVATILGNTVTITGIGTSIITANQAAAGAYSAGVITTTLTVTPNAAPTPSVPSANVISLFSNAYTNVGIDTWRTSWTPAATTLSDIQILGNDTKLYTNLEYVGVEFTGANTIDATSMQYYHVDVWTPNATIFRVKLVDWGANGTYGGGDDVEHEYVVPTLTQNGWNSYDIPLSAFTGLTTRAHLEQMIFSAAPAGSATTYIDNVYFYNLPNAPLLSNFSIPLKVLGAAPFTITAPTSNSSGAFTYTSGNTSVATIVGNTITVLSAGTSTITATQAAAGGYTSGTIAAPFVVTVGPIMIAAPVPTNAPANVLSLFSDTYTATSTGIDWFPNWGQSTVVTDTTIVGNTTKKYATTNYQGVQFASPLDVSNYEKLHIDVWTPNCTSFKVFLINTSPVLVEQSVTLTPTLGGWNSYDIVLASSFRGTGTLSVVDLTNVGQMKIEAQPFGSSTLYFDNIYFYKNAPLPVSLASFTATKNKNLVSLYWSTLTELGNKGFEIEKSIDGLQYAKIGFVNGNDNSTSKINYTFVDTKPFIGINYYRLKQIDNNGRFTYSTIQAVRFSKNDLLNFSFFPNPAKDVLKVNIGLVENDKVIIKLMNIVGQTILSQSMYKSFANTTISFNISSLKAGIYFIQLNDGTNINIEKVIIN